MNACNASGFSMLFSQSITPSINIPIVFEKKHAENEFIFEVKNNFHTLENLVFDLPSKDDQVFVRIPDKDIFVGTTEHIIFFVCHGYNPLYNFLFPDNHIRLVVKGKSDQKIIKAKCTRSHLSQKAKEKITCLMPCKSVIGFNSNSLFSYSPLDEKHLKTEIEITF